MKILMLSTDFIPNSGGVAIFLHHLCLELNHRGHQVDVLTSCRKGHQKIDAGQPYQVFRYATRQRLSSLAPLWHTLTLHRCNRYDIVFIGHFMTTHALGALILRKLWGVPYVILSHGNDLRYSISTKIDEWVARWLMNNGTLMLGNSHFTVERIRAAGYHGTVQVLNPGVDTARFHPAVDTAAVRQKYELDARRVLLTTARLVAKKNVEGVLRALPQVIEHVPNVLFVVVGDGEERERLETLCTELGLRSNVRFLGHFDNSQLPALYCASDLFVMPSYQAETTGDIETFGISFVEASACAIPVIGGRSGGIEDAVIEGETGLLVDPHNVGEIAAAIIRLLTDRELAHRLGQNGRRRVEREFSWDKVGEELEGYLKQVTNGG